MLWTSHRWPSRLPPGNVTRSGGKFDDQSLIALSLVPFDHPADEPLLADLNYRHIIRIELDATMPRCRFYDFAGL